MSQPQRHQGTKVELQYQRQVDIPITYDGIVFDEGLRLDVLVEETVICELKAVDKDNPLWKAQLLSHLKLTEKRLGFIINFNVPLIRRRYKESHSVTMSPLGLRVFVARGFDAC